MFMSKSCNQISEEESAVMLTSVTAQAIPVGAEFTNRWQISDNVSEPSASLAICFQSRVARA